MDANTKHAKYAQAVLDKAGDRPLFIFGAGEFGNKALEWFPENTVTGFLDNNTARTGTDFSNVKIYSPAAAAKIQPRPFVLVASVVIDFLRNMCEDCIRYGYEFVTYQDVAIQVNDDITDIWEDGESATVYKALVRLMKSRQLADLPPKADSQYFQPFIPMQYFHSIVDGGAYTGDTYCQCKQYCGNRFEKYYAFEPDNRAFEELTIATNQDPRVRTFQAALSNIRKQAHFQQAKYAFGSHLSMNGDTVVNCVPLDKTEWDAPPTFIKLDVEGAEPEALVGAAKTIEKYKPALAVCVYHDPFHLWSVPQIIRELMPKTKLYLRHHSEDRRETVCYAVP